MGEREEQWISNSKAHRAMQRKALAKSFIAAGHSRLVALKKAKLMVR